MNGCPAFKTCEGLGGETDTPCRITSLRRQRLPQLPMHPLAHMMTGAVIGQTAHTPAAAFLAALFSHYILDIIPHTEAATFRPPSGSLQAMEIVEAGAEVLTGTLIIGWLAAHCVASKSLLVAVGTLAGLLPDLIDLPLNMLAGISPMHVPGLHWTVRRQHFVWGILSQVAVAGVATLLLWRASCR